MTTTLADPYLSQPDWWITIGREPIPADPNFHGAKDCTLVADLETIGLYHLELGNGGIDAGHREVHVDSSALATVSVVDTDNTHKLIRFQNSAGAGIAPDQIAVAVRRLTSA